MLPPRCPIVHVSKPSARRLWLHAQRLDTRMPFGEGPEATAAAVEHLGYVQIDTINVIERAHHHTLWARIPTYRRRRRGAGRKGTPLGKPKTLKTSSPARVLRWRPNGQCAFRHAEDLRADRASFWMGETPGTGVRETGIRVSA